MVRGLEELGAMPDSRNSSPVRGAPVQLPQVQVSHGFGAKLKNLF